MTPRQRNQLVREGKLQVLPPDNTREPQFVDLGDGLEEQFVSGDDGQLRLVPGAFRRAPLSRRG